VASREGARSEQAKEQNNVRRLTPFLAALALAACGGSSHRSSAGSTSTSPGSTHSAVSTTTTTTSTLASSSGSSTPVCRAADLTLSYLSGQGAMGHGDLVFTLRNSGSTSCRTYGFPGVLFLDRAGKPLPTIPTRTTHDYFGSAPAVPLLVAPGQTMSFRLGVTHGMTSTAGCTTAYGLQVIPPNDTASLRAAIGDGGAYECRTVTVSPLRPGTSASPS
jgi:hypothetical protein